MDLWNNLKLIVKPNRNEGTRKMTTLDGETFFHISRKVYGTPFSWRLICKMNNIKDPFFVPDQIEVPWQTK